MEKLFFKSIIHLKASKSKYFERFLGWLFIGDIVNRAFPTIFGIAFYSIGFLLIPNFKDSMPLKQTLVVLSVVSQIRKPLSLFNEVIEKLPDYLVSKIRLNTYLTKTPDHV